MVAKMRITCRFVANTKVTYVALHCKCNQQKHDFPFVNALLIQNNFVYGPQTLYNITFTQQKKSYNQIRIF